MMGHALGVHWVPQVRRLLSQLQSLQVLQGHVVAEMILIHGLHHIGLVVPKCFGSKENIHQAVTADHLQDRGTGAEGATAATPVAKGNTEEVWGRGKGGEWS